MPASHACSMFHIRGSCSPTSTAGALAHHWPGAFSDTVLVLLSSLDCTSSLGGGPDMHADGAHPHLRYLTSVAHTMASRACTPWPPEITLRVLAHCRTVKKVIASALGPHALNTLFTIMI